MLETLLDQNFVIGAVVGFAAGALAVIGLLLAVDAYENRRKHGGARADLRSGPR